MGMLIVTSSTSAASLRTQIPIPFGQRDECFANGYADCHVIDVRKRARILNSRHTAQHPRCWDWDHHDPRCRTLQLDSWDGQSQRVTKDQIFEAPIWSEAQRARAESVEFAP